MLTNGERGVLVTVLQSTPLFYPLQGSHWIWHNNQLKLVDGLGGNRNGELEGAGQSPSDPLAICEQTGQVDGSVDWEDVRQMLTQVCQQALGQGKYVRQTIQLGDEWIDVTCEPILPRPRLVILGGGHVGQALAEQAHLVEMSVVVVDDRPDFANDHLYPQGVRVICGDFLQVTEQLELAENDYLVIVTRGHQYDRSCLTQIAGRKLAYVGMIGSRRRVAGLFQELEKEGIDLGWLEQVHSPIGLDIGAETPQEIGVSILAELIQVMRKERA